MQNYKTFFLGILFLFHLSFYAQNYKLDSLLSIHENNKENEKILILIGESYAKEKKWELAIKFYSKLVDLQPNNSDYLYRLGGTQAAYSEKISKLKVLQLINKAKYNLVKSSNLDPRNIFSRWVLVQILTEMPAFLGGDKNKAKLYCEEISNISKIHGLLSKQYLYHYQNNLVKLHIVEDKIISLIRSKPITFNFNYFNYKVGILLIKEKYKNYSIADKYLLNYIKEYSSADRFSIAEAYYFLAFSKYKQGHASSLRYLDKSKYIINKSKYKDHDLVKKVEALYKKISK